MPKSHCRTPGLAAPSHMIAPTGSGCAFHSVQASDSGPWLPDTSRTRRSRARSSRCSNRGTASRPMPTTGLAAAGGPLAAARRSPAQSPAPAWQARASTAATAWPACRWATKWMRRPHAAHAAHQVLGHPACRRRARGLRPAPRRCGFDPRCLRPASPACALRCINGIALPAIPATRCLARLQYRRPGCA